MTVLRQCLLLLPCLVAGCKLWDDDLGYLFKASEPENAPSFELPAVTDTGSPAGPIDPGDSGSDPGDTADTADTADTGDTGAPDDFEPIAWSGPIEGGFEDVVGAEDGTGWLEALADADGRLSGTGTFALEEPISFVDEVGLQLELEPTWGDGYEGTLTFDFEGGILVAELAIAARQLEPTKIESDVSGELDFGFDSVWFEGSFVLER